jgi:hypothetical protein
MTAVTGFDSLSDTIDRAAHKPRQRVNQSAAIGSRPALDELGEVWEECRTAGWDGYGALPVEPATLNAAYCVLDSLPLGFPLPSISAEPDGHLTLEWRKSPHCTLTVSVDPDGYLHYAGLFGLNRRYGTIPFFSTTPDELLRLIREL